MPAIILCVNYSSEKVRQAGRKEERKKRRKDWEASFPKGVQGDPEGEVPKSLNWNGKVR